MPENAGKLEVEYIVISASAMRKLERLETQFEKVEKAAEKQSKTMQKSFKKASIAMAAFGAVAVGVLYSIIKSSSYASMWFDQLKYTVMRFADKMLILTGMKDDIDDLFRAADKFLDLWEDEGLEYAIVVTMTDFSDWWDDLSTTKKLIYGVAIAVGVLVIGLSLLAVGVTWVTWVGGALTAVLAWLAGGSLAAAAASALLGIAIGLVTGQILVWLLTKAGVYDWFAEVGKGYKNWEHWIKDVVELQLGGILLILSAFYDLKNFDFDFTMTKTMLNELGDAFTNLSGIGLGKFDVSKSTPLPEKGSAWFEGWDDSYEDKIETVAQAQEILYDEEIKWGTKRKNDALEIVTKSLDDQTEAVLDNISDMEEASRRSGYTSQDAFSTEFDKIPKNVEISMDFAADYAQSGADLIDTALAGMKTDYVIDIRTRYNGGFTGGGSSWDAPGGGEGTWAPGWSQIGASEPTAPGQPDVYSATGGHVLRSGTAVIHQGEDIVNLNKMMAGARFDNPGSKEVVINNTINITSSNLSNPMEVGRVADTISRRMGGELHRISTSI